MVTVQHQFDRLWKITWILVYFSFFWCICIPKPLLTTSYNTEANACYPAQVNLSTSAIASHLIKWPDFLRGRIWLPAPTALSNSENQATSVSGQMWLWLVLSTQLSLSSSWQGRGAGASEDGSSPCSGWWLQRRALGRDGVHALSCD